MTFDEFIKKNLGKGLDYDGVWSGQCVDLYRFYVRDVLGFEQSVPVGGAADIWHTAQEKYYNFIKNTALAVPQKGDIVIWNRNVGGGFGHVAIFIKGDVNSFTSLDQNWPTLNKVTKTWHNYNNVIGWLRPKGKNMSNDFMQTSIKDFERIRGSSEKWDKVCQYLQLGGDPAQTPYEDVMNRIKGYKSRETELSSKIGQLQAELENEKEKLALKEGVVIKIQADNKSLKDKVKKLSFDHQKELGLKEARIKELNESIEALMKAKGELNKKLKELEAKNGYKILLELKKPLKLALVAFN